MERSAVRRRGGAWAFFGRPVRPRPGELESFRETFAERLRAGQAAPVRLRLVWTTGVDATLRVEPLDEISEAWWRSSVVPAYPSMTWRPIPTFDPAGPARWRGRPLADVSIPFRSGLPNPWSDAIAPVMRSLPSGWSVEWLLEGGGRPDRAPILRPEDSYRVVPPNFRTIPALSRPIRETEDLREHRRLQPVWSVTVGIHRRRSMDDRSGEALARTLAGLSRQEGGNGLVFARARRWWRTHPSPFLLTTAELLGVLPTPWSGWYGPADPHPAGTRFWTIGADEVGRPVRIPIEPGNGRHLLLVGETGMGKSTLMVRMASEAAKLGAVVILDPLGETGRAFLERIPSDRGPSTTWVAPADSPIPLNALRAAHGSAMAAERAIADLVAALRRVRSARFESAPFWGPRIEETTHWALTAAAGIPGGTLVDAERILGDPRDPPEGIGGDAARDALRALRERARDRPEELEGAHRMISEANRTSTLRSLLSEPEARWSARDAVAPGAITVITGDAGTVGAPTSRTLLALYLALLASAVEARSAHSPIFLFLDEASWYAHESLTELLRVGRRWGLHAVVASQSLEAFPPDLRESLWTNVSDQIRFRGSPTEARELERWGAGLTTEQLVSLPRGVAAALLGKGREVRWIVTTPGEASPNSDLRRRAIAEASSKRWSVNRAVAPAPVGIHEELTSPNLGERRPREAALLLGRLNALCEDGTEAQLVVSLAPWRAEGATPESAIRAVGRLLTAEGLLRSERASEGTVWRIDRVEYLGWYRRQGLTDSGDEDRGSEVPTSRR